MYVGIHDCLLLLHCITCTCGCIVAAGFLPLGLREMVKRGRGRVGVICVFCLFIVCLQVSDHPAALVLANNGFSRLVRM